MSDFKLVQLLNPFTINSNINPTGVYSPSTSYGPGDSVSYGNSSYLCIAPTTGNVPTNTTYWQLLASAATNKLTTTARNNSGVTIPKGSVVYFNGALGNLPTIALSLANSEPTSSKTVGITAAAIANNSNGEVVVFGLAESLDTSALTVGLSIWLSPTVPGGMTNTKPAAPDHAVFIGTTTRSHPTDGTIEVRVQNGFELQELHNVAITSVADNQVLKYDAPTSLWKNETLVKADVGLDNVDNTADLDKGISTATQAALDLITDVNWTGDYNNGVTYTVGQGVMFNGASFRMIAAIGAAGYSPAAYPGNWLQVTDYVSPNDIGLGNVNNTADIDKIISTDTQNALDLKQDSLGFTPANDALSNLGTTAVNTNIIPQDDKVQELGQDAKAWAIGYFSELRYNSSRNVDIENRLLKNSSDNIIINYEDAVINDKSGILSIDAEARKLGTALDYSNNSNVQVSSDFTAPGSIYADAVKPGSVMLQSLIGNGFLELPAQTSGVVGAPSTTGWRMHTTSLSAIAFKNQASKILSFNTSAMTGNVDLSVGNTTGTIATIAYVDTKIGNTFESVSKNLRQYNYSLNYSAGVLTSIVYTVPSVGTITKTLNYTSGVLTSVVLSGSTPASVSLTKTLNYTSGVLTSVAYS